MTPAVLVSNSLPPPANTALASREPATAGVMLTPEAARSVAALCAEGGPVAFVEPADGFGELFCLGRADLAPGTYDVLIGEVAGCPVYVDRRARRVRPSGPLVIDATDELDGPRFELRPRTCGRSPSTTIHRR